MRLQHANHVVRFDFKECSYPLAPSNICYKAAKSGWNITLTSKEQNRMHVSCFSFGCSQILAPPLPPSFVLWLPWCATVKWWWGTVVDDDHLWFTEPGQCSNSWKWSQSGHHHYFVVVVVVIKLLIILLLRIIVVNIKIIMNFIIRILFIFLCRYTFLCCFFFLKLLHWITVTQITPFNCTIWNRNLCVLQVDCKILWLLL